MAESKIAHFGLIVDPESRKAILQKADSEYEGKPEQEEIGKLNASNQQMAVLGLNTPDAPYTHEQDGKGKYQRMAREKAELMRWGAKNLTVKEKVKVKATQVGLLEDGSALVAKLEGNSAKCEKAKDQEKVRDVMRNGMNASKGLHVVIRKRMSVSSSEVANKVRLGEVKYTSLKEPVEIGVAFSEKSGKTIDDVNNAKVHQEPKPKKEAKKEDDEMTRVGTHTVKTSAASLEEFKWGDGAGILSKETPGIITLATEQMTRRGEIRSPSNLSARVINSLCPLPGVNTGMNERRNFVLAVGVERSAELSRLDEAQADRILRRADVVVGITYLNTGTHHGPDNRASCIRAIPQASTKALSHELSDALAYAGTAATASAGMTKEWDLQLARCLLSNDVPRREGAHAQEKQMAKEVYSVLADQKSKSVGRSDALLRMIEAHRSDVRKIMGLADLEGLRYHTVTVRLYVAAAANVQDGTISLRRCCASTGACRLIS
ncbi:unnamed protein product [Symbiodinium natans]|uniref:Uncharacterized protein n=1 Tax=Symbiodinium natans TaxID=878477 RepID=A0A812TWE2_9DINO|nr:unnamed protein product [Symbiodinium natans]